MPGQDHFHGLGLADRAGQALRAAGSGDRADIDLGLTEFGVIGGDDDVAHHRKLAAAAQSVAGDRGDDRLLDLGDALPGADEVALLRVDEILRLHLGDISACSEHPVRTGQDHGGDIGIGVEGQKRLIEFVNNLGVNRVHLGTIEGNHPDGIAAIDQ